MSARTAKGGECAARLDAFCAGLQSAGLDGAVLDSRDDQFYYTGFTGSDAMLLVAARRRRCWLVTDSRYTEEAAKTAPGAEATLWRKGFAAHTGGMIRRLGLKRMGYVPRTMTVAFFEAMRNEASTTAIWHDVEPAVARQRSVKSRSEVAAMRRALACAEAAFLAARKRWKPGMTETEVKNDLEWEMRRGGAEDAAFETIVAVGANASLPHAHAGSRKIQTGKMLLVDFGARLGRYNSDLTRTLWAGSIPPAWQKRYSAVLAAQRAGIEAIRAGVPGSLPHGEAVTVFSRAGIADRFTHGLGHGVGLAVHEDPRLGGRSDRLLEAGNIVTVEPGVYFPGAGGIRVEDMALVTEKGVVILSSLPKSIEDAVF